MKLAKALSDPVWISHIIGNEYSMDGVTGWKIAYYPIFEDGKTGEAYEEPKALVEKPAQWKQKVEGGGTILVDGTDFREVPLRYLQKAKLNN